MPNSGMFLFYLVDFANLQRHTDFEALSVYSKMKDDCVLPAFRIFLVVFDDHAAQAFGEAV